MNLDSIMPDEPQIRVGAGSEGGHWYIPGTPVRCAYEILGANGKWRPVTMRDARKYGWVPGVSSITRQEHSPGLERWKARQVALSALTHPKVSEVSDYDELLNLIEQDAKAEARQAAERGTAIHGAIEHFFQTGNVHPDYEPYVTAVRRLLHQLTGIDDPDAWTTEVAACHPFGYGGRVDLFSTSLGVVVDFKGKEFDRHTKFRPYPDQGRQLSAYREMTIPDGRAINLFVSRNHPGLVREYEWEHSDLIKHWREFVALLHFWQVRNNFPTLTELAA